MCLASADLERLRATATQGGVLLPLRRILPDVLAVALFLAPLALTLLIIIVLVIVGAIK